MPPPPVTPSPHRFVVKKQPPIRKTPLAQEQTPRPSTQQFKATPRFNFSSTPGSTPTQTVPSSTPSAPRFVTTARRAPPQEDIVDNSSNGVQDVHDSIETDEQNDVFGYISGDGYDDYKIEERTPKRRRVSTSPLQEEALEDSKGREIHPNIASSPLPILSSPPATRVSKTAPRFLISTPASASIPQSTQTTFSKPPRFRPPDPSEQSQTQADPLPDQFSPHRRGHKYVAGGLAAEVRDWLVNIESSIPATSAQKSKEDPWLVKLVVDEISGGGRAGMALVSGRLVRSDDLDGMIDSLGIVKVMLAGEGVGTGLQRGSKVEVGKTIGIKGPVWEVVVEGEKWGVGVDWKILP